MAPREILFVGNGSYNNRGCEAIVRGSMRILNEAFPEVSGFRAGVYADENDIRKQNELSEDKASGISSFRLDVGAKRFTRNWLENQLNRRLGMRLPAVHRPLLPHLRNAVAALEIGGDNYSLDYGVLDHFLRMDQFLQSKRIPVFLWGASVGPFDDAPVFCEQMIAHLKSLAGIFVRETASLEYLASKGVSANVHLMADPAFLLEASQPLNFPFAKDARFPLVGVNFSPLLARQFDRSQRQLSETRSDDLVNWKAFCGEVVTRVCSESNATVWLIPHVSGNHILHDDHSFLRDVQAISRQKGCSRVHCVAPHYSASQLKWIISQCDSFIGARTHSTIASISSCVPTLSLSYSLKAKGINQDVFDTLDYCIPARDLTAELLTDRIMGLLNDRSAIHEHLRKRVPLLTTRAIAAGQQLRRMIPALR